MTEETITSVKVDEATTFDAASDVWMGVMLETSCQQKIWFYVSAFNSCCEQCEWFISNDEGKLEATNMEGYQLLKPPYWTNTLRCENLKPRFDKSDPNNYMNVAILNLETDHGIVQLVASNEHNGYYPRDLWVGWKDFEDTSSL